MGMETARAPATPCFMSPRMAFSTQFTHDSPIEILTSPKGRLPFLSNSSRLSKKLSMRRLSRRCKILLILVFALAGAGLFVNRKMNEYAAPESSPEMCSGEDQECEEDHVHPGLAERFMHIVSMDKIQEHFHNITREIQKYAALNIERPDLATSEAADSDSPTEDGQQQSGEAEGPSPRKTTSRRATRTPPRKTIVVARQTKPEGSENANRRPLQRQGRNGPQGGRRVKIPPGINPRRYGL